MKQFISLLTFAVYFKTTNSQLIFAPCDYSSIGDSTDLWSITNNNQSISLYSSNGSQCISLNSGCCFGEDVRGGDLVVLSSCNSNDIKQRFAWPSLSFNAAPNTIVSTATGNNVSPSVNGNVFVIDGAGSSIPGTAAQLRAYRNQATSAFIINGSSTLGARLVHAGSGLCLKKGGTRAQVGPTISLSTCNDKKQIAGSTYFGSQLFSVPKQGDAGAIIDQRGYCVTAAHSLNADNTIPGEVKLVGATCSSPLATSQIFLYSSNGTISTASGLFADSNGGTWLGTPISLLPNSNLPSTIFILNTTNSGGSNTKGSLVHKATGLCLDTSAVPSGHGCLHPSVYNLPYCDPTATLETRVSDLVSRLTLSEAIGFLGAGEFEEPCSTYQPSIARLDIPVARQLIEVTSMASGVCLLNGVCPTAFASGLLLGGSFNKSVWLNHGIIIGKEMRAQSNIAIDSTPGANYYNTLSGHGPDINQPRDPRNGRIGELISEDTFLTGMAAEKVIRGMQFGADIAPEDYSGPLIMNSNVKHYQAYSLETNRFGSKGNVSMYDLWDSYLTQYERPMTRAAVSGTMCSYFSMRIEGETENVYVPSCSDKYILTDVIRTFWNRPDATHLTDCGAVWNQAQPESAGGNGFVSNLTLAVTASVNAGCDMNSNTITPTQLPLAVQLGLVNPSTITDTASRILAQRFRVGQFDPLDFQPQVELLSLGVSDIGTAESRAIAAEGVIQSLVLVRNDASTLPLVPGIRVALLGPQGASFDALKGDCYCNGFCTEGSDCFPSLQTAIENVNVGGKTVTFSGVSMKSNDTSWSEAIASVANSDVVILALGTDTSVAAEGKDRSDGIGLPGLQGQFGVAVLQAAKSANVPVVLLLLHNLPVSFDELVLSGNSTYKPVDAIVDAWAPMTYANEVAGALFGKYNRWGRATMTVYPKAYADQISIFEYSMTKFPGRSYKYYDTSSVGIPLISFGTGLSFSTFNSTCTCGYKIGDPSISITCNVKNTAGPDGDEVLMIYHRPSSDIISRVNNAHPLPLKALVDFQRVSISAGNIETVQFNIPIEEALGFINEDGATALYPGTHYFDICNGNTGNITLAIVFETLNTSSKESKESKDGVIITKRPPRRV
jgi:beta-glucosidase-like glycosyl hydrolase